MVNNVSVETKRIDTDVLVIGGGSAGLFAAIRAMDFCPKVTLVDKGIVASAGISTFIHVVTAPVPEEDIGLAMKESVEHSTYLCDQPRLQVMLTEIGERVREADSWGVPFERDGSGKLYTAKRMGQKFTSCVFVEGREMILAMKRKALSKGVEFVERVMITDLLTSDGQHPTSGQVVGAVGLHTISGHFYVFKAKVVIIASGLVGAKLHLHYADNVTGDGHAMALRAGCELQGMETDWAPAFSVWNRTFSTGGQAEYMRAGAKVINKLRDGIIERYASDKEAPSLSRVELCQAAAKEVLEGRGPVYLDMTHLKEEDIERMRRVLPIAMRAFDDAGIDLLKQQVEITPIFYNWLGGIRANHNGESAVNGLYAVGASAHRGNNSGFVGVPQAYGFVFGYRAGEAAGKLASNMAEINMDTEQARTLQRQLFQPLEQTTGPRPSHIYRLIHKVTVPLEFSVFKHEKRINITLAEVQRVLEEELAGVRAVDVHDLVKANEARNFVPLSEAFYRCALERKESRFSHYREDYPYRDDVDWLKWVIVKRGQKGLSVRTEPIQFEEAPAKPEHRLRVPVSIRISLEQK
ncbi:FAD-dependent oxidoreductase [Chloroflexota bacterium]